ncbi:MAG: hypothetical protein ACO1SX_02330 [Actinomycetota bacterium]
MGGKVKVIAEQDYPPEVRTPEERFAHLARRLFKADPAKVRQQLAEAEQAALPKEQERR